MGCPTSLDRESVRRVCLDAAANAHAAERAFVASMAWGHGSVGYGRWRTGRILADTSDAGAQLRDVAKTLAGDGAVAAYRRLASYADCRLEGLGPAFGTKYLYFVQPPRRSPRALILDALVADWLDRETDLGLRAGAWSVATYERYLGVMHEWAASLDCSPDELESCMFRAMATERGNQWGGATPTIPGKGAVAPRRPDVVVASRRLVHLTPAAIKGGTLIQEPFRTDVYTGLVRAAVDGRLVAYSDLLPGDPRHVAEWAKYEEPQNEGPAKHRRDLSAERAILAEQREAVIQMRQDLVIDLAEAKKRIGLLNDQDAALNPPPRSRVPTILVERNGRMVYVVPLDLDFMAWEPARLNGILRSLWSAVELDKDYTPIRAIWRDPSTRKERLST